MIVRHGKSRPSSRVVMTSLLLLVLGVFEDHHSPPRASLLFANGFSTSVVVLPRRKSSCSTRSSVLYASNIQEESSSSRRRILSSPPTESSSCSLDYQTQAVSMQQQEQERTTAPWTTTTSIHNSIWPVISAALLITSNTVGASMLVLPQVCAPAGMSNTLLIFAGAYAANLWSGFTIADLAIGQQQEQEHESESSVSSFQQVASAAWPQVAPIVAALSIALNGLVMAFNLVQVDHILSLPAAPPPQVVWSLLFFAICATCTNQVLAQGASILVVLLFATFGALIVTTTTTGGGAEEAIVSTMTTTTAADSSSFDVTTTVSVVLMSLVYQNIVPTITKLLEYDAIKTKMAIALGSFLPLAMYVGWTVMALQQHSGMHGNENSMVMTIFSLVTIAGSSLGCLVSLAEEFDAFGFGESNSNDDSKDKFSIPAVATSVMGSLALAHVFGAHQEQALSIAGAVCTPLLYGLLPMSLWWQQQQEDSMILVQETIDDASSWSSSSWPGAVGMVGGAAGWMLLQQQQQEQVGEWMTDLVPAFSLLVQ